MPHIVDYSMIVSFIVVPFKFVDLQLKILSTNKLYLNKSLKILRRNKHINPLQIIMDLLLTTNY